MWVCFMGHNKNIYLTGAVQTLTQFWLIKDNNSVSVVIMADRNAYQYLNYSK